MINLGRIQANPNPFISLKDFHSLWQIKKIYSIGSIKLKKQFQNKILNQNSKENLN